MFPKGCNCKDISHLEKQKVSEGLCIVEMENFLCDL